MATTATYPGAFIDGEWQAGKGAEIEVRNPFDDSLIGTVNAATDDQLEAAVAAAASSRGSRMRIGMIVAA